MDWRNGQVTIGSRTVVARTCNLCGELLSGKHFSRSAKMVKGKRYWITEATCQTCIVRRQRARQGNVVGIRYAQRQNDSTVDTATKQGDPWTLKECDLVVQWRGEGLTLRQIAIKLHRTYYATCQAASTYGLTKDWPTREHWVIQLPND